MSKTKHDIGLTSILERNPHQDFSKIDDEIVMLNQNSGEYYALNPIGSRIWEIIEKPIKVDHIIQKLTLEFDVGYDICAEQTIEWLNELSNKSLLSIIEYAK